MSFCCFRLFNLLSNNIDSFLPIFNLRLFFFTCVFVFLQLFALSNLRFLFLNNLLVLFNFRIILILLGFSLGLRLLLNLFFILLFAVSYSSMLFNFSTLIFIISWHETSIDCRLFPGFSCCTLLLLLFGKIFALFFELVNIFFLSSFFCIFFVLISFD